MSSEIVLRVKLWGVRGSLPAPLTDEDVRNKQARMLAHVLNEIRSAGSVEKVFGEQTDGNACLRYLKKLDLPLAGTHGGNTTCFEVQARNSPLCIVDAGSGIRLLGESLLKERFFQGKGLNPLHDQVSPKEIHLFLTHYHWDHIQGFPFFAPAFIRGIDLKFYGKNSSTVELTEVLRGQQASHYFPVSWKDLPCCKGCYELPRLNPSGIQIGEVSVGYTELDHPGSSFGYSFSLRGRKISIIADTEHRDVPPPNAQSLAKNADVIYWDAQYLPEEYRGETGMTRYGWGHSTYEYGVTCALMAKARCVVLGHHDPNRNDFDLKELEKRAIAYRDQLLETRAHQGKTLELAMAQEGMVIEVTADGKVLLIAPSGEIKVSLPAIPEK